MPAPAAIVMPLLRQVDAYLAPALRSAIDQTVPTDVIVVISPRTPASNLAILERFARESPRLRVVMRPEGAGFPGAINAGIRDVTSPRFGLLLSDDWLDPDAIEMTLPWDADVVSAGMKVYDADGTTFLPQVSGTATAAHYASLSTMHARAEYLRHFFLFRTATVRDVGGLDETLGDTPGIDDYDFVWTLLEHGATVALPGRSVYNCRDHPGERMTLRDPVAKGVTLLRILEKHGVVGAERDDIYRRHVRWYGRTLQATQQAIDEEKARARSGDAATYPLAPERDRSRS
jgi:glycosyltransferase involved in cell wall biosynthesis